MNSKYKFPPINLWNFPINYKDYTQHHHNLINEFKMNKKIPHTSTKEDDGNGTSCYDIPENATTLDHLILHKNMPFWLGTIFKCCYAFSERSSRNASASQKRELNKIAYYINIGLLAHGLNSKNKHIINKMCFIIFIV